MKLTIRELVTFALLGTLMFASKQVMEFLPNVHLLGVLTMVYTLVYRRKALYPIYICVGLQGLLAGFNLWWIPYLYLWAVLWGVTMLLPQNLSRRVAVPLYAIVCGAHGLLYGTLYAPAQAVLFGLDFRGMLTWIAAGLPWDVVHGLGNLCLGLLIVPLVTLLRRLEKTAQRL